MKKCIFTIADENNMKYANMMAKSLRKFHSAEELPLVIVGPEELKKWTIDPFFFYRATPVIAAGLMEEFDTVIKIDADSIITGDLSASWTDPVDAACVFNSNPREYQAYPYTILDINPLEYLNCGYVVMKSKELVKHWKDLCFTYHFNNYQMKEQDLLNIIAHYGNYQIQALDVGDSLWGLSSKGYWKDIVFEKGKLMLHPQEDGYPRASKYIKIIHWAGGNEPQKMNYRTKFKEDVVKYLDKLVK